MMTREALDEVMTADEFIEWVAVEVESEAVFTEENNEARTRGDYIADLRRRLSTMLGLDC